MIIKVTGTPSNHSSNGMFASQFDVNKREVRLPSSDVRALVNGETTPDFRDWSEANFIETNELTRPATGVGQAWRLLSRACLFWSLPMKKAFVIAGALFVTAVTPALADEYYVVRGPDRHCTVTTTRPEKDTVITQIGPLAFKSRNEAEDRIKTTKVCSDDATTGSRIHIDKD